MTRAEVVAAKRELRRLRQQKDQLWFRNANGFADDSRDARQLQRIEREIAELERKLVQEGTQGWR